MQAQMLKDAVRPRQGGDMPFDNALFKRALSDLVNNNYIMLRGPRENIDHTTVELNTEG